MYVTGSFLAVGASIKYKASTEDTQNGIRFAVDMSDALYAATIQKENVEMGTLVIPTDLLGESELTLETTGAKKTVTYSNVADNEVETKWGQSTEDIYYSQSVVYLWNIPDFLINCAVLYIIHNSLVIQNYLCIGEFMRFFLH